MVMVNAAGWRVEKVIRTFGDLVPMAGLRVSWRGYWQADCRTSDEVAEYVDLSTLVPEPPHEYHPAPVKAPWKSASDLHDALETATLQTHQLAKSRSAVEDTQQQLRSSPNSRRLPDPHASAAMNFAIVHLENAVPTFSSG